MIPVNKRKIGVCILLSILTFGLYQIYWGYLLVKNTRAIQKDESSCTGEMLCLLFVPFYSYYWWFTRGKIVKDKFAEQGYSAIGNEIAYLILGIFGLTIVSMAIMQNDFNSLKTEFTQSTRRNTKKMVLAAMMTALVIVFQLLATYTTFFGPFSTAIALIPIAIGACLCGPLVGAWLGLVFGIVVLATGGAALFFAFSIPGTIVTVLTKGAACGLCAGLVYKVLEKKLKFWAAIFAAFVCPVVNTGVFLLGSAIFFLPHAADIAKLVGLEKAGFGVFIALALGNFVFEVLMNVVLSPAMVRILKIGKKA